MTDVIEKIRGAFARNGHRTYGEHIDMREHMLQAAFHAESKGADPELITAALLHDYGHLLGDLPEDAAGHGIDGCHEQLGAGALAAWFPDRIVDAVRLHVAAKRYLCGRNPAYLDRLTPASLDTLRLQGGPMDADEMTEFDAHPARDDAVAVRVYDDLGKEPQLEHPDLDHYLEIARGCILPEHARSGEIVDMGEYAPYAHSSRLAALTPGRRGATLTWDDGFHAFFHYIWLRDHCACATCRHPQTRERLVRVIDLPVDLPEPAAEITAAGALELHWPAMPGFDPHRSLFDPGWLRQRADPETPEPLSVDRKTPWDASIAGRLPEIDHGDFMHTDDGLASWLRALNQYGFAVLRNGPVAEGEVLRVAERVGWPRETNFGRHFDVMSKPDPNNAAYTAIALEPHADLPNWERPPDFQLLYCLTNEARGGESILTDGYAVAEALKAEDAEAFRLLNELAIDFRFQDEASDIAYRAPVIGCDEHGKPVIIRFNNWIRETLRLPAEQVEPSTGPTGACGNCCAIPATPCASSWAPAR